MAAHTRRRASVLVIFVVCLRVVCCRFDKADATADVQFSDTAVTDRHSDTTIFQLRAHWVRISWSVGSEKSCAAGRSQTLDSLRERRTPYPLDQALLLITLHRRRLTFIYMQFYGLKKLTYLHNLNFKGDNFES